MQSKKRTLRSIGITGALVLGGMLFAVGAEANDRHHGERIHAHLDFLAVIAAFSGDPLLAYALDHRGHRIEHSYSTFRRHRDGHGHHRRSHHRRESHRWNHRHTSNCGHADLRIRISRSHHRRH